MRSSPDITRNLKSRRLRRVGHGHEAIQKCTRILVTKLEGKIPLGLSKRTWEDIKMDLREVCCDDGDWIDLAQDRFQWRAYVRNVMNLRVP